MHSHIATAPIPQVIACYARLLEREENPRRGLFSADEMALLDAVQARLAAAGYDVTALAAELTGEPLGAFAA